MPRNKCAVHRATDVVQDRSCKDHFDAYLEVEIKAFAQVDLLGEALVLPHVKRQGVVAVGVLPLAEEDGVVEAYKLTSRHSLQ